MRGRYAPSPTGSLHVGNALAAAIAWERASVLALRVEDLGDYAVRFSCAPGVVNVEDQLRGSFSQNVHEAVGDFVIARRDGVIAYQLAVVVDDVAMGIEEVVRGGDLLYSTPRQIQLYEALGATPPKFAHTALVLAQDGTKLSKRDPRHTLAGLRAQGVDGTKLRDACLRAAGEETVALGDLIG